MSMSKFLCQNCHFLASRARIKITLEIGKKSTGECNFSRVYWRTITTYEQHVSLARPLATVVPKRSLFHTIIQRPGTGINMPGQGLKKIDKNEEELKEQKSPVLKLITKWEEEQKIGMEKFPLCPDYKLFIRIIIKLAVFLFVASLLWPEFIEMVSDVIEEPVSNPAVISTVAKSPVVYLYKAAPLRLVSRIWGRLTDMEVYTVLRPVVYGAYSNLFSVNMDEALVKDFKMYKSLAEFFRRPLDLSLRPIDSTAKVVCPCDGKVLSCGKIVNGRVEQVKGVTYSLQKLLGPLVTEPSHDKWGSEEGYEYDWKSGQAPLQNYHPALMKDPENNDLFHCVFYLAPGDYHRFHSPVEWTMKHRRHFPGDLLSVNPRIANIVKDLFILNERVVLSGEWKHGYFSVTPVGATNVGSIKVYEDVWLNTNRLRFKPGTYFETNYGESGYEIPKGEALGEFNLGSTIVLIFEAPKETKLNLEAGQTIRFGQSIF
uniref:phosphatidylserine decarboxylase n=1 Tax=Phallusia mammillata TaxID=59560 RepID=A0A6F9DN88_9ASCI|nr:phosphatidylserine decarboxylase proenzyme-like [Phallusia mammillata]